MYPPPRRKQKIKKILNQATTKTPRRPPQHHRILSNPTNQATATRLAVHFQHHPHPLKPSQPGDSNAPRRPLPTPSASTQTLSTRRQQRASPSASTYIGSTSHIQHRSIHTQVNNLTPPQPRTPKKSPRGVQRGRGFTAPLRFSFFPKTQLSSNKQISFFRLFLNIFIQ